MKRARRQGWSVRRRLGIAFIVVGVVWMLAAGTLLVLARSDASAGSDQLERARQSLSAVSLLRGAEPSGLREARDRLERAHGRVSSFVVAPFEVVPFVGSQIDSVDALSASAVSAIDAGLDALAAARREIGSTPQDGPARVVLAERLSAISKTLADRLDRLDLGPSSGLIGPVDSARRKFVANLSDARAEARSTANAAAGLAAFLKGPTRYLVAAANNAEMRAGSGMWLNVGALDIVDGAMQVSSLTPTRDFALQAGQVPISDRDLADRWGSFTPQAEWRNLMASPRLPASAQLATTMWKARTGQDVQGVLVIDPVGLRSLLRGIGAVTVDGASVSADNVVALLLNGQYASSGNKPVDVAARDEQLGRITSAVLQALNQRSWDPAALLEQLIGAARGRHLLAWSSDLTQQAGWRAADLSGELNKDSVLVSLENIGTNKLDYFTSLQGAIETRSSGRTTDVTVTLKVANATTAGQVSYVAGPRPGIGLAYGAYRGVLTVDLPGAITKASMTVDGQPAQIVIGGADGPARVAAINLEIAAGQKREVQVHFTLPFGVHQIQVEPSARYPGIQWTRGSDQWTDGEARTVRF